MRTQRRSVADEPEVIRANGREIPDQGRRNSDLSPRAIAIMQEQAFDLATPATRGVHHDPAFISREHADAAVVFAVCRLKRDRDLSPVAASVAQKIALALVLAVSCHPSVVWGDHGDAVQKGDWEGVINWPPLMIVVAHNQARLQRVEVGSEYSSDQPPLSG